MYHISDLKKFERCPRLYFYTKEVQNNFHPYLRSDESLNDLLISYLCPNEEIYLGVKNDPYERFVKEKDKYDWFNHPRFENNNLRVNIPFLHKIDKQYEIYDLYFVYYGTTIKEIDTYTYSLSLKIFRELGYEVRDIYLIYFNGNYINKGVNNPQELFVITDKYKDSDLKKYIEKFNLNYQDLIKNIDGSTLQDYKAIKCKFCKQNGICEYYHKCFENEEELKDNSILTLVSSQYKNKMFEQGIRDLKDADMKLIEGNKVQYAQIMADKNGGLFVDKLALKHFLDQISARPISFIDFEWDSFLVPPYINMKPLDVLCFEFALYYIDENGKMEHRTFVGTKDTRKDFIEALKMYVPSSGPILAYNAQGAEKLRLKQLSEMFPEDKSYLDSLIARFVDLADPFIEGYVYDTRMAGNYTLKKLVDICSEYSYADLDIYDGLEAVYNWRDVDMSSSKDEVKIVDNLKEYCSLDSYGLFLVYKWLVELYLKS